VYGEGRTMQDAQAEFAGTSYLVVKE